MGSVKALGGKQIEGEWLNAMGQALFAPPNVRGWISGRHWLNSATFLARVNFAGQLVTPDNKQGGPLAFLIELEKNQAALAGSLFEELGALLLGHPPAELAEVSTYAAQPWTSEPDNKEERAREYSARLRGILHLMMSYPQYQLS